MISFAKNRARKDGLQTCCRKCKKLYDQQEYRQNKPRALRYNQQHRQEAREFIASYLEDKQCERCGFQDSRALDFDHINPKTKYREISKMRDHSIESIKKEIAKCRILCANCHRIHTAEQRQHTGV